MRQLLLPWTTRGVNRERQYLASTTMDLEELKKDLPSKPPARQIHPDMTFGEAMRLLAKMRGPGGGDIEYGCFEHNGMLITDPALRFKRQCRNILHYTIRDLFNISRGMRRDGAGMDIEADPVPPSPEGNWAVFMSEACPYLKDVERALRPLVKHRSGKVITIPKMAPGPFTHWLADQFNNNLLPSYLLICDSPQNVDLEYQYIFNAFGVAGRLWFDEPDRFDKYVEKVLALERGQLTTGRRCIVASPVDDDVTYADNKNIIAPLLKTPAQAALSLEPLVAADFGESALLDTAASARFLALYCHGLALREDEFAENPDLQGSLVLKFGSKEDEGLLSPSEVAAGPFVPGGIVFSPACVAGGTQKDSDFAAWVEWESLAPYLERESSVGAICQSMLGSPEGPAGALMHFDISMASTAPMYHPLTQQQDLQRDLHQRFIHDLAEGQTLGKATSAFRWAAGVFYGQAIYIFGQIAGTNPYLGFGHKTIGQFVNSMNQYHVIATDMRDYVILGDPAVRLIQ